jgi:hypothetical protein
MVLLLIFFVLVVGNNKNPTIYFVNNEYYYDNNDQKQIWKVGDNSKFINEYLLHMDLKSFNKIFEQIKV